MTERSIDQAVKHAESRQLLRSAVPLIAAGVGAAGRLEEIRSPRPSTGRHYAWLFAGWACVVAGLLIPPYVLS